MANCGGSTPQQGAGHTPGRRLELLEHGPEDSEVETIREGDKRELVLSSLSSQAEIQV